MQPIRILSLIEGDFITGAARPLYEFARRTQEGPIAGQPVEQTIVVYRRGNATDSALVQELRAAGIRMAVVEEQGRFDPSVPERFRRLVAEHNPDIFETNNIKSHFFGRLSGIWKQRPWVAFHHGFTTEDSKMRVYNLTSRWSLQRASSVVTVCGPFRDDLVRQGVDRDKIHVQHNPVAPFVPPSEEAASALRNRIPAPEGAPLIIAIGRLSGEKGHADLIDALSELVRAESRAAQAHLAIAGEGPERASLEARIERMGLKKHVTFLGLVKDVRPLYAAAELMVLPSHSEGSPNVLLEAMAAGCPIVSTRVGGVPEIVDEASAVLVPPRVPAVLAQGIRQVLEDATLGRRLAETGRRRVSDLHTIASYAEGRVRFSLQLLGRA